MMEAYYPEAHQQSEHLQAGGNGASLPNRDIKVYITNEYYVRSPQGLVLGTVTTRAYLLAMPR